MILFRFLVVVSMLLCFDCLPLYAQLDNLERDKLNLFLILTDEDRDSMIAISKYFQTVVDDINKNKLPCDSKQIYNLKLKNEEYDVVSALKLATTIVDKISDSIIISYPIIKTDSPSLTPKFLSITSLNKRDLLTIFSFFRNAITIFDKIQDADMLFVILKSSLKTLGLIEVYDSDTFQTKLACAGVCVESFRTLLLHHQNFVLKNKQIISDMLKLAEKEITSSFKEYIYSNRIIYVYQLSIALDIFSVEDCLEDKAKLQYIDSLISDEEFFQWKKIERDWKKRRDELLTNLMAVASKEYESEQYYPKASEEKIMVLLAYYNSYKIVDEIRSLSNILK
jgi:hypothetical protein